jgi:hypothetical protein
MEVTNTLAYCDMAAITVRKKFYWTDPQVVELLSTSAKANTKKKKRFFFLNEVSNRPI